MPIVGFTDDLKPRFPRLGKLRKGGERVEKTNAQGKKYLTYGEDLPYFRFTGETPAIQEAFKAAYGEQPDSLRVFMAYPTPNDAFPTWAELWGQTGLVHRCDGRNMTVWLEDGKYVTGSKPCPGGHKDNDPTRDAIGRLHMFLPELLPAGFVGHVTLETHSKNDIVAILSVLMETYAKAGDLTGIAFLLRRVKTEISTPGFGNQAGKRSKVAKWLVRLEPEAAWVRKQLASAYAEVMALPAGDEDVIDGESREVAEPPAAPKNGNGNGTKPANGNGAKAPDDAAPSEAAWKAWMELVNEANALHIEVAEPPAQIKIGALRKLYGELQAQIDAARVPQPPEPPEG